MFDAELGDVLDAEGERVLLELSEGSGPFSPGWPGFRASADWPQPQLPSPYRVDGSAWNGSVRTPEI